MKQIVVKTKVTGNDYRIRVGNGLAVSTGQWALETLGETGARIVIVSNKKVFGLYGGKLTASVKKAGFDVSVHLIGDGERAKSIRTIERLLSGFADSRIGRNDAVLALGGGVVGDVAGFAASVHLRGVRFLQVPTTLLSMIDSSVGGKTGVNTALGKNLIGTFHHPAGVLVDPQVLSTLDKREIIAGLCEAVKHAVLSGRRLLALTSKFLDERNAAEGKIETVDGIETLLTEQIAFKAAIVEGDQLEDINNNSSRSRKTLNLGHTFGHALENATQYRYLKHGEAVGHGLLFAGELSKGLEILAQDELNLLYDVVHRMGSLPPINKIHRNAVISAILRDKKSVGRSVQWVLLEGIGKPKIFSGDLIPQRIFNATARKFLPIK